MTSTTPTVAGEIERYLRTGDTDPYHAAWSAPSFLQRAQLAGADLENALVTEVVAACQRVGAATDPDGYRGPHRVHAHQGGTDGARALPACGAGRGDGAGREVGRVPRAEQHRGGASRGRGGRARHGDLANLYLGAIGADLLADDAPQILGISEETTCYVSPAYFDEEDPFADFVVHEVAHIFHNCKRRKAGLSETRRREWLLDIEYRKRETFAYACEAYACVLRQAKKPAERVVLAAELRDSFGTGDARVEPGDVAEIVREAAARRNGWKVILERCAPPKRKRPAAPSAAKMESER